MDKVVRITSKIDGFRRAGVAHPARPVDHPLGRFTEAQLDAMRAEPALKVEVVEAAAPQAPDLTGQRAELRAALDQVRETRAGGPPASGEELLDMLGRIMGRRPAAADVLDAIVAIIADVVPRSQADPGAGGAAGAQAKVPDEEAGAGRAPPARAADAPAKEPKPPTEAEKRFAAIRDAVGKLGRSDVNQDGTPKVKAVEKLVGFDTTAKEIAAAMAAGG